MNTNVLSHDARSLARPPARQSVSQLVNLVDWTVEPEGKSWRRGREEELRMKKRRGRGGSDSVYDRNYVVRDRSAFERRIGKERKQKQRLRRTRTRGRRRKTKTSLLSEIRQ